MRKNNYRLFTLIALLAVPHLVQARLSKLMQRSRAAIEYLKGCKHKVASNNTSGHFSKLSHKSFNALESFNANVPQKPSYQFSARAFKQKHQSKKETSTKNNATLPKRLLQGQAVRQTYWPRSVLSQYVTETKPKSIPKTFWPVYRPPLQDLTAFTYNYRGSDFNTAQIPKKNYVRNDASTGAFLVVGALAVIGCIKALIYSQSEDEIHSAINTHDIEKLKKILAKIVQNKDKGALEVKNAQGNTPLISALLQEKIEIVDLLIDAQADLNAQDAKGRSAIMIAIDNNLIDLAEKLAQRGAKVGKQAQTYFIKAITDKKLRLTQILIKAGANIHAVDEFGRSMIELAAKNNLIEAAELMVDQGARIKKGDHLLLDAIKEKKDERLIRLYLRAGANINAKDQTGHSAFALIACNSTMIDLVKQLIKHADINATSNGGYSALMNALFNKHKAMAKLLIENGANIHQKSTNGETALSYSVQDEALLEITEYLIKNNVDVNAPLDSDKDTPLILSVRKKNNKGALLLLKNNANAAASNNHGNTALLEMVSGDFNLELAEELLKQDKDINKFNNNGWNALGLAARNNHREMVEFLLTRGADIALKNKDGENAIDQAKKGNHQEMQNFLKKAAFIAVKSDAANVSIANIAGKIPDAIQEVVNYLKDPAIRENYNKFDIDIGKGLLLWGPPGTGKTALARAIADEAQAAFMEIKLSELQKTYFGESAQAVAELFKDAREKAKKNKNNICILFIDEVDAIASKRGEHDSRANALLNALLSEIDGFAKNQGVFILASTNRLDVVDPAFKRPGRLRAVEVGVSSEENQRAILDHYISNVPYFNNNEQNKKNLIINHVIKILREQNISATPALLEQIVKDAARAAINGKMIAIDDALILKMAKAQAKIAQEISYQKIKPVQCKERFAQLAGSIPKSIVRVVEYIKNPEMRKRYDNFGVQPYKGILLYGPPGSGKTALARAIAGESNAPFFDIKATDIQSKMYGESEQNINRIFEEARAAARASECNYSIIFIDEIDSIAQNRNQNASWINSTLNTLLVEMDGFQQSNVIVIAGTNRPESLDPAIMRPGRFDKKIHIGLPGAAKQKSILDLYLSTRNYEHALNKESKNKLMESVLRVLQENQILVTPVLLKSIVDQAAIRACHMPGVHSITDKNILDVVYDQIRKNQLPKKTM